MTNQPNTFNEPLYCLDLINELKAVNLSPVQTEFLTKLFKGLLRIQDSFEAPYTNRAEALATMREAYRLVALADKTYGRVFQTNNFVPCSAESSDGEPEVMVAKALARLVKVVYFFRGDECS